MLDSLFKTINPKTVLKLVYQCIMKLMQINGFTLVLRSHKPLLKRTTNQIVPAINIYELCSTFQILNSWLQYLCCEVLMYSIRSVYKGT